ncbi:hypothetical protein QO001_003060 [Methylobacterium brachiatum]|uniref:DUF3489 domain-containing protein n=1 Tax=Methylobacterium brachiatum TaxID=269660 RepID=A0AAJ1TT28_9HYPH|nr:DUF3489 domain-containing protein [Methylobacterium brachiatum]MCB4803399.1 DUF3489 domain-containing protein [Methylobacterium brachiatum]MDQ0544131.1 hypothetical protein [Methylobacterium brachiatum]
MPTDPLLTPQHRDLLAAAARRPDHRLTPPERVTGGARRRLGEKLVALSVAETVTAADEPIWVRVPSGEAKGLQLTVAGLAIIDVDARAGVGVSRERTPICTAVEPRAWTKIARVLALLRRPEGADLQMLAAATGWLPHTTRAALTGLRRKGHAIHVRKREADGRTVYRIETTAESASGPTSASSEAAPATPVASR